MSIIEESGCDEKAYVDKESKLVKGKFLIVRQDVVAKLDQWVVVAPHNLSHLQQQTRVGKASTKSGAVVTLRRIAKLVQRNFAKFRPWEWELKNVWPKMEANRGCVEDLLLEDLKHRAERVLDKRTCSRHLVH